MTFPWYYIPALLMTAGEEGMAATMKKIARRIGGMKLRRKHPVLAEFLTVVVFFPRLLFTIFVAMPLFFIYGWVTGNSTKEIFHALQEGERLAEADRVRGTLDDWRAAHQRRRDHNRKE